MVDRPPVILMNAHSLQRNFQPHLVRELSARCGAEVHFYCNGPVHFRFYEPFLKDGTFSSLTALDHLNSVDEIPPDDTLFERAQNWEGRCGTTFNELSLTNRHFGRGFWLGGLRNPRSHISETTNYRRMVAIILRRMDFWEAEIAEKKADLCIDGPRELIAACEALNLPFRRMLRSRYGNNFIWIEKGKYHNPNVEPRFRELPEDVDLAVVQDTARTYAVARDRIVDQYRYSRLPPIRLIARKICEHIYYRLIGSEKQFTAYWHDEVRNMIATWRELRDMYQSGLPTLADVKGRPFVFFPLQGEPELSLHGNSPEFFFQLEAIAALARDLPAGVMLAVKETYFALGRRPADFYNQIRAIKNVVFLDMSEPGLEVVKQAAITATISGSPGHEAAALGKPVISFGRNNPYNFLDHVHVVEDLGDMKELIRTLLKGPADPEKAERDGRRFQQAVIDCCFDMDNYNMITANRPNSGAIEAACASLFENCKSVPAFAAWCSASAGETNLPLKVAGN